MVDEVKFHRAVHSVFEALVMRYEVGHRHAELGLFC